jgi:hypothetical protein
MVQSLVASAASSSLATVTFVSVVATTATIVTPIKHHSLGQSDQAGRRQGRSVAVMLQNRPEGRVAAPAESCACVLQPRVSC